MMRFPLRTCGRASLHAEIMLLVAALITAGGLGGCSSQACTLVDCQDGVTAELSTPLSASDIFLVRVSTPEADYERTVTPDTVLNPFLEISVEVKDGLIRAVRLNGHTPSMVEVQIERDGQVVFDEASDRISYGRFYPNGADCDSGCRVAHIEL